MARPLKEINWDEVELKMKAGCSAKEICGSYMDLDTFYRRFKDEYGKSFGDYSARFHETGKGNIKAKQYSKAMEGNIQMLLWLGKNWLGQKDREEDKGMSPNDTSITELLAALKEQTKDKNAIKPEADPEFQRSE